MSNVQLMNVAPPPRVDCVILSPHFDDAVLSTWHALASDGEVRVVTVYAGIPQPGFVTALDRARGATESAEVVQRRREHDRAALALAGRAATHVDLLDADYRAFRTPELREAIERAPAQFIPIVSAASGIAMHPNELERAVRGWLEADLVYAPLGIGGHPDHRDVGRFALQLAERGRAVRFYADLPYLLRHGPPSWLGGGGIPARADAQVQDAFAALPATPGDFDRTVVELTAAQAEAKIAAFARYATEFDLVDADFGGAVSDPDRMRREVYWTLRTQSA
jgi:LmbE family N-acetylglucosaminyl deacetylase